MIGGASERIAGQASEPRSRLEAVDLAFGYPGHAVGRGVSLAVAAGEVVCLLGPNGGGKSTLFRTMLGLLPAQGGEVRLDGTPIAGIARRNIARRVSYVPQAHAGYFPFTVIDVVLMGRTAHLPVFGTPGRRDHELAHACLARLGLAALADKTYTRVSGGERQLVLVARALAQEASIVVMDEPTANLDLGNQVRVLDTIRSLAASGTGVILATHDPDQAFVVADRVALLHGGRLVADAPPVDAITPATLREVYGIEAAVVDVDAGDGTTRRVVVPASAGTQRRCPSTT